MSDEFDRAAVLWVERRFGEPGSVSEVTFNGEWGGGCDTCGYGPGLEVTYMADGEYRLRDLGQPDFGGLVREIVACAVEMRESVHRDMERL